jgi:ankyrin repeat protein
MKQGWIAGYPPWFFNYWIKPANCKTAEQTSRLLHLLRAIEDGQPDEARRLLPGIDPNLCLTVEDDQTESLLEWAAEKARHLDCFRLLVSAGASVKAPNLVRKLVAAGRTALLPEMLEAGADPNSGPKGETALISACWSDAEAVRLLLGAGARTVDTTTVFITNKKRVDKVTPLMVAAYAGQMQTVKLLLDAGADINTVDAAGNTALAWAKISRAKAKAAKIIQLLEQAGASAGRDAGSLPEPVDFATRASSAEFR